MSAVCVQGNTVIRNICDHHFPEVYSAQHSLRENEGLAGCLSLLYQGIILLELNWCFGLRSGFPCFPSSLRFSCLLKKILQNKEKHFNDLFCARSLIIPNLANIYMPNIAKEIFLLLLNLDHLQSKRKLRQ